ncbi:MAG: hypothetical protein ACO3FE_04245 [Planctomycetaceae bacterium]
MGESATSAAWAVAALQQVEPGLGTPLQHADEDGTGFRSAAFLQQHALPDGVAAPHWQDPDRPAAEYGNTDVVAICRTTNSR